MAESPESKENRTPEYLKQKSCHQYRYPLFILLRLIYASSSSSTTPHPLSDAFLLVLAAFPESENLLDVHLTWASPAGPWSTSNTTAARVLVVSPVSASPSTGSLV